jgi:hypothetical protein
MRFLVIALLFCLAMSIVTGIHSGRKAGVDVAKARRAMVQAGQPAAQIAPNYMNTFWAMAAWPGYWASEFMVYNDLRANGPYNSADFSQPPHRDGLRVAA